jgi:hypothetical protein
MRKSILLATGLLITAVPNAYAADCNQGTAEKRIACLQEKVDALTKQVGQIPKLDSVVIQWSGNPNSCITYLGHNVLQVVDTCVDPNRNQFVVRPFHQ